jgi:hypothetical protein
VNSDNKNCITAILIALIAIITVTIAPVNHIVLIYSVIFLVCCNLWSRDLSIFIKSLKLTLPIAIPLLIVHGVLNPNYHSNSFIFGVPIRFDGIYFASEISAKMMVLTYSISQCAIFSRDKIVSSLINVRLIPKSIVILLIQSITLINYLKTRSEVIMQAQISRGMPSGPSIIDRTKLLVSTIIPLIAITIVESHSRTICLMSRGFGTIAINLHHSIDISFYDKCFISILAIISAIHVVMGYQC